MIKPMIIFPVLLIAAITVQCLLALKQGNSLGNTFSEMNRKGNVLVGKYKSYCKGGAYLFLSLSSCGLVEDARVIYGRTIFSSVKKLPECVGKDIHSLNFEKQCIQKAYEDGIKRYKEYLGI